MFHTEDNMAPILLRLLVASTTPLLHPPRPSPNFPSRAPLGANLIFTQYELSPLLSSLTEYTKGQQCENKERGKYQDLKMRKVAPGYPILQNKSIYSTKVPQNEPPIGESEKVSSEFARILASFVATLARS